MVQPIDPKHSETRAWLRFFGPLLLGLGALFAIIGIGNFFWAFNSFEPPRYFWCAFIGLPLMGIGAAVCKFAYFGAVTRYMANEVAPVGKDVVNYMADGTKGAFRDLAGAIGEGFRHGSDQTVRVVRCHKCNADNELPANFCKGCGAALTKTKPCGACQELNDADSRFCDNCGKPMT